MLRKVFSRWLSPYVLPTLFVFFRRKLHLRPLRAEDLEIAAQLLTEEFCRREPLCRHLRIATAELLPFFREQVAWSAKHDLGIVALNATGTLVGVMIADDHCAQYQPNQALVTPTLNAIGSLLDNLALPPQHQTEAPGEVCYFGLAAVRQGQHEAPVLALLLAGLTRHAFKKGYRRAYAKVTNPAILARMRKHDRFVRQSVFEVSKKVTDEDFPPNTFAPLQKFRVALVSWPTALPVF